MDDNNHFRFTECMFDDDLQQTMMDHDSEIDQLFNSVQEYRGSEKFKAILDFCANFRHIAPFNALLINMQQPGSDLALTLKGWRKYHRKLAPNARPLFYLNMTPVGAMYDIGDTLPDGTGSMTDQEIIDAVANPYRNDGKFDQKKLESVLHNLQYYGIAHDMNFNASTTYAARIEHRHMMWTVSFDYRNIELKLPWEMPYLISVNNRSEKLEQLQSICHELGHFFCHHLQPEKPDWWEQRRHDVVIREFEAETTAYMVCKRNDIPCPRSDEYLAGYVAQNKEIPHNISVETIMKAVNSIEKMLLPQTCSQGLLYNVDKSFKTAVKREKGKIDQVSQKNK